MVKRMRTEEIRSELASLRGSYCMHACMAVDNAGDAEMEIEMEVDEDEDG